MADAAEPTPQVPPGEPAAQGPAGEPAPPPSLSDALGWIGFDVDDADGACIGRVQTTYVDATSGEPAWLIVAMGRRRSKRRVAVPVRDCAGGGGRVWTPHAGGAVNTAPTIDPRRPLLREHELTICAHYGIGERVGRAAEVAARPEGSVTSNPV